MRTPASPALVLAAAVSACTPSASDCTSDSDCAAGQVCQRATATASGTCVDSPASGCTHDFDCAVGQVCRGASGSTPGTCTQAGEGSTRAFGSVSLDFPTGNEAYLLSVMALPAGPAADGTQQILFSLGTAGASAALRAALLSPRRDGTVDERIAFESARHAEIEDIARRYAAKAPTGVASLAATATCGDCGASAMCWQGSCTATPVLHFVTASTAVPCQLAGVVSAGASTIDVLVDDVDASSATNADAVAAVQELATTFPGELSLLGLSSHGGVLDRDGDGRLTVVFTSRTAPGIDLDIVGFFDPNDFLDAADAKATGNVADILWSRVPGSMNSAGTITEELAVGTLTHEYVHLASYATRVQARLPAGRPEVLWLDEGLAHLMEDLAGWGGSNIGVVAAAFGNWNSAAFAGPADSVEQRGKAFLLLRYFVDRVASSPASFIGGLLGEEATGLEHGAFRDASASLWLFQLASYATHNTDVTASIPDGSKFRDTTTSGTTGVTMGVDPFGSYTDARGDAVSLTGPEVAEVSGPASTTLSDGSIVAAGTQLFVVTGGQGTTVLTGTGPADVDLRVNAQRIR